MVEHNLQCFVFAQLFSLTMSGWKPPFVLQLKIMGMMAQLKNWKRTEQYYDTLVFLKKLRVAIKRREDYLRMDGNRRVIVFLIALEDFERNIYREHMVGGNDIHMLHSEYLWMVLERFAPWNKRGVEEYKRKVKGIINDNFPRIDQVRRDWFYELYVE